MAEEQNRPAEHGMTGEGTPITDEIIRTAYQILGLKGTGMMFVGCPVDKDGFLPLGQVVFLGGEEDLQELGALGIGLFNKGYAISLPGWFLELAGLPLDYNGEGQPNP